MSDFISSNDPVGLAYQNLAEQLSRIEAMLVSLANERHVQDFYTTAEFAQIDDRSEFTCREWCRTKRINASKRLTGRGNSKEWRISHDELLRFQSEGLLPLSNPSSQEE